MQEVWIGFHPSTRVVYFPQNDFLNPIHALKKKIKWLKFHGWFLDIAFYSMLLRQGCSETERGQGKRRRASATQLVVWVPQCKFRSGRGV